MNIDSVDKYFNNPPLSFEPKLCPSVRSPRSKCRLCIEHCPSNALTLKKRELIIGESCQSCGICASLCPTGALKLEKVKESEIIEKVRIYVKEDGGHVARFKCRKDTDDEDAVVLPCLFGLTENILLSAFISGASGAELKLSSCSMCPLGKADFSLKKCIAVTESLLSWTGASGWEIKVVKNFNLKAARGEHNFSTNRRRFLSGIKDEMKHMLNVVLPLPFESKRKTLLKILKEITERTISETRLPSDEDNLPFAMIEIDDNCLGCNVCSTLCPASALERVVDKTGEVKIKFSPKSCVKCGLCVEVCLPRAIRLKKPLPLEVLMATDCRELIRLDKEKDFPMGIRPSQPDTGVKEMRKEKVGIA